MKPRKILAAIVGAAQSTIGISAMIFVYALYIDFLGVQTMLNVNADSLPLYLLILSVFGFFSIANGFLLVHEGLT